MRPLLQGAREAIIERLDGLALPAAERRRVLRLMELGAWLAEVLPAADASRRA